MAILYTSVSGRQITAHSHSGGEAFSCPRKYRYLRLDGWQSREESVNLVFGKAIESAIQYHHQQGRVPETGIDEFKKIWFHYQQDSNISYTEKSGTWDQLYKVGSELLSLYEGMLPSLPIQSENFQIEITKSLFPPGHEFEGLEFTTKLDMVVELTEDHPLLPVGSRRAIIDIKTSSNPYNSDPRMSSLDPQLIDYAWVSGIDTVAFLVLIKNHTAIEVGDWVTVLTGKKVGKKYRVLDIDPTRAILINKTDYEEFTDRKKGIKGSGSKERIAFLTTEYFYRGHSYPITDITKQGIQFLPAVISQQDMIEAEEVARQEAIEIAMANRKNFWPKKPGVRYPHNHCISCEMLGLCIGDPEMVKEKLIQINGDF